MRDTAFEKKDVDESVLLAILRDAQDALEEAGLAFALIGGIPAAVYGRPRSTEDLDILVKPEDKEDALRALDESGFETEKTEPEWLFKAMKKDVLVDLIFRAEGNFYLDDLMASRTVETEYKGQRVKLVPPEDLLIMKAVSTEEEIAHYWFDALAVLVHTDIDWDYLIERSQHGAKRMLSLLIYAQSSDVLVPDEPIRKLFHMIYDS